MRERSRAVSHRESHISSRSRDDYETLRLLGVFFFPPSRDFSLSFYSHLHSTIFTPGNYLCINIRRKINLLAFNFAHGKGRVLLVDIRILLRHSFFHLVRRYRKKKTCIKLMQEIYSQTEFALPFNRISSLHESYVTIRIRSMCLLLNV